MSGNAATFVRQEVPTMVQPSQSFEVSILMQNTGTTVWTRDGGYKLGSQNPRDNNLWSVHRVELQKNQVIRPREMTEFRFTVNAPGKAGIYEFQWQMVRETVEWFGEFTPNVVIQVGGIPPPEGT